MLTEDYVSYEVAKLLKEKGFDESTTFVWYQHLPVSLDCQNLVGKKVRDYFYHDETTEHNSSYKNSRHKPEYIYGDIFSCPTHQMAMKWLRERCCYIVVNPDPSDETESTMLWWVEIMHKTDYKEFYDFDTYEEAVEAALKYSLENLI